MIADQTIVDDIYVDGEKYDQLPTDLYIPPDAMRVLLDSFSGPLDLLLYLIRKQNIDILDIPIVKITQQYLLYIDLMETHRFELAAEYLLMAATLAEIKSRLLLPSLPSEECDDESDPRMALVRQLQQYERMKQAAELLYLLPCLDNDFHSSEVVGQGLSDLVIFPVVELDSLVDAMRQVLQRQSHSVSHQIQRESLSVRDRMTHILEQLKRFSSLSFYEIYDEDEGRLGLVVSLLAILELAKEEKLKIEQKQPYSLITIRA